MRAKQTKTIKMIADVCMTVLLLCLMAYQVTGEVLHEWFGIGMTAQLKALVDRFCAFNSSLNSRHLKSALLTVAWNADDWTFDALSAHYRTLVRYIHFEDKGMILGYGCGTPSSTKRSRYPDEAYRLGKNL